MMATKRIKGNYEKLRDRLKKESSIMLTKGMIHSLGLHPAVMLCELISKGEYFERRNMLSIDGYFFNTIENIGEDTGLSRFQQDKAIEVLLEKGIISTRLAGIPAKRFFRVEKEALRAVNITVC